MYSPGFNQVHTVAEKINRKNPYSHCIVPDRIAHIIFTQQQQPIPATPTIPSSKGGEGGGGGVLGSTSSLNTSIERPSTSPQTSSQQQQQETTEQRFRRLCRSIPPRLSEYTSVTKSMPPGEQLLQIQQAISSLQYNFLPQTFFNLRKNRPLKRIFETAKEIIAESLPIRCLEATFLALYLTQHMKEVKRIPLAFKSTCNGRNFRHIVLVVEMFGKYGVLGMSRRSTLMDRLPCRFDSLIDVVEDFRLAYKEVGHRLSTFKVGLYTTHNPQNYHLVPCWRFMTLKMPLLAPQPPKALAPEPATPTTTPRQHLQDETTDQNCEQQQHKTQQQFVVSGDVEEYLYKDGMYLTHSGIALRNLQAMLTKLSVQYHSGASDLEPPAVTPNKSSKPTTSITTDQQDLPKDHLLRGGCDTGVRQILFSDERDDDGVAAASVGDDAGASLVNNKIDHNSNSSSSAIDQEIDAYILKETANNKGPRKSLSVDTPVLQVPLLEEVSDVIMVDATTLSPRSGITIAGGCGVTTYPEEEEEDEDGGDSDTELNQCRTYCVLYCRSPFHPRGSLEQLLTTSIATNSTTSGPVSSPARAKALKKAALSAPNVSNAVPSLTAGDVARQAAEVCPGFDEFMAAQREIAAAHQTKIRQQLSAQQKQIRAEDQQRKATAAASAAGSEGDCAAVPASPRSTHAPTSRRGSASPQRRASTAVSGAGVATPNKVGPQKAVKGGKNTPPPHRNTTSSTNKSSPNVATKPPKASRITTTNSDSRKHQDKSQKTKEVDISENKTEWEKTKKNSGHTSSKNNIAATNTANSHDTAESPVSMLTTEALEVVVAVTTASTTSDIRDVIDGHIPPYVGSGEDDVGKGSSDVSPDSVENFMPASSSTQHRITRSPSPHSCITERQSHSATPHVPPTRLPMPVVLLDNGERMPRTKGELLTSRSGEEDSSSLQLSGGDISTSQHPHNHDNLNDSNNGSTIPPQSVVRRLRSVVESCQSAQDDDAVVGEEDYYDVGLGDATRVTSLDGASRSESRSSLDGMSVNEAKVTKSACGGDAVLCPSSPTTVTTTPHPPLIERRSLSHLPRLVPSRSSSFVGPKIISLSFGSLTPMSSSSPPSRQVEQQQGDVTFQGSPIQRLRTPSTSPQGGARPNRCPSSKNLARTLPAGSSSSVASALVVEASIKSPIRPRTSLETTPSTPSPSNKASANNKRDAWRDLDLASL